MEPGRPQRETDLKRAGAQMLLQTWCLQASLAGPGSMGIQQHSHGVRVATPTNCLLGSTFGAGAAPTGTPGSPALAERQDVNRLAVSPTRFPARLSCGADHDPARWLPGARGRLPVARPIPDSLGAPFRRQLPSPRPWSPGLSHHLCANASSSQPASPEGRGTRDGCPARHLAAPYPAPYLSPRVRPQARV